MPKSEHTPGPWAVAPSSNPNNGSDWRDIVSGKWGEFSPTYVGEAMEKDAHLVAAAPELLAASEIALAYFNFAAPEGYQAKNLRAAIAKAKGQA